MDRYASTWAAANQHLLVGFRLLQLTVRNSGVSCLLTSILKPVRHDRCLECGGWAEETSSFSDSASRGRKNHFTKGAPVQQKQPKSQRKGGVDGRSNICLRFWNTACLDTGRRPAGRRCSMSITQVQYCVCRGADDSSAGPHLACFVLLILR